MSGARSESLLAGAGSVPAGGGWTAGLRLVADPPCLEQGAAGGREVSGEVDALHAVQGPGQAVIGTAAAQEGNDPLLVAPLLEREQQLALHPLGPHCRGREHEREPVASAKRLAD